MKGTVESGVNYAQENAVKGHRFDTLAAQNAHLRSWEAAVADTRIHGTTRKQVQKLFLESAQSALQPLPANRFPMFQEGQRRVHRDGYVEVDRAYYSVPPEFVGRTVWVRWDGRLVRVFTEKMEPIAVHGQRDPGTFATTDAHIPQRKRSMAERGATDLLQRAGGIGRETRRWGESMLEARGVLGLRVLVGLLSLAKKHRAGEIEAVL